MSQVLMPEGLIKSSQHHYRKSASLLNRSFVFRNGTFFQFLFHRQDIYKQLEYSLLKSYQLDCRKSRSRLVQETEKVKALATLEMK